MDFDGTLAPIVAEPDAARPLPGAADLLARLAQRWGRVAVVSGRPVSFLAEHIRAGSDGGAGTTATASAGTRGPGGPELLGLYGLERMRPGEQGEQIAVEAEAEPWRPVVDEAADEAVRTVPAGVRVEHKGLTVTLHYRSVPALGPDVEELAGGLAARTGLVAHRGKMSIELRPPLRMDKGTVVRELSVGLRAVLFAGDDLGDLPAFAELDRLRESGTVTLAVASGGPETPPEVVQAADVTVDGPPGLVDLLERLLAAT